MFLDLKVSEVSTLELEDPDLVNATIRYYVNNFVLLLSI